MSLSQNLILMTSVVRDRSKTKVSDHTGFSVRKQVSLLAAKAPYFTLK